MIDLYAWNTPNGRKITIMLEEAECNYKIKLVNLDADQQFAPDFLAISPNNKIPAIVDHAADGAPLAIFESGAILQYLADRTGHLLPATGPARYEALQWLYWQVGGFGPMLGQFRYALDHADEIGPFALKRFTDEAVRLFSVLDRRLSEAPNVGGANLSIADVATYPLSQYARTQLQETTGRSWDNVARWEGRMAMRPAVGRGMAAIG